jgi:hypothetical protein
MRGGFATANNVNDARASSYCFQENCNPEPNGSCIQERRYLDRAPEWERRPGAVFLALLQGAPGAALVWRSFFFIPGNNVAP